jgi:hypothetical protein
MDAQDLKVFSSFNWKPNYWLWSKSRHQEIIKEVIWWLDACWIFNDSKNTSDTQSSINLLEKYLKDRVDTYTKNTPENDIWKDCIYTFFLALHNHKDSINLSKYIRPLSPKNMEPSSLINRLIEKYYTKKWAIELAHLAETKSIDWIIIQSDATANSLLKLAYSKYTKIIQQLPD